MKDMASGSIKVNLFIQPSDFEFMLQVLKAFKKKKMIDFKIDPAEKVEDALSLEGPPLTEAELLRIMEEAEKEPKVSYEAFKAIFEI